MKWMLIVVVFGTMPVKSGLTFDSLDDCLKAEDSMRAEYSRVFNSWLAWARKNPAESGYPDSQEFILKRDGLRNSGTCIPYGANNEP